MELVLAELAHEPFVMFPRSRALGRAELALRRIVGNPTTELRVVGRTGPTAPALQRFLDFVGKHGLRASKPTTTR